MNTIYKGSADSPSSSLLRLPKGWASSGWGGLSLDCKFAGIQVSRRILCFQESRFAMTQWTDSPVEFRPVVGAAEVNQELLQKCEKVANWLSRLASAAEERAKDTRFIALSEANAADAKNYRATEKDIRDSIAKARKL
jgi:hypothetical protein